MTYTVFCYPDSVEGGETNKKYANQALKKDIWDWFSSTGLGRTIGAKF